MKITLQNALLAVLTVSGLSVMVALVFFMTIPLTGLVSFTTPVLIVFGAVSIYVLSLDEAWD